MSEKYIIDSSALIMAIYQEYSKIDLTAYFANSCMHHINVSEVIAVLIRDGMPEQASWEIVETTISETIATNFDQAKLAANIRVHNKEYGISTGDSFCLAAAKLLGHTVITADKVWTELKLDLKVICIR
jgi:ribonuclease VapC